jgi:hypothetical protein
MGTERCFGQTAHTTKESGKTASNMVSVPWPSPTAELKKASSRTTFINSQRQTLNRLTSSRHKSFCWSKNWCQKSNWIRKGSSRRKGNTWIKQSTRLR